MDLREHKALEIAARSRIRDIGNGKYSVPSQTGSGAYTLEYDQNGILTCDCPDFALRRPKPCKHALALMLAFEQDEANSVPLPGADSTEPAPKEKRKTYPQDWPNYNLAQTQERRHFMALLADLCQPIPSPPRKPGCGRAPIPMSDAIYSAVFKVFSTLSARRFNGDLEDAHERGYVSRLPSFNSVLNVFDNPAVTPILTELVRISALPLRAVETKFAVDSSGFCTSRFIRWFDVKYGVTREKAEWVKVHICTGVETNVVTAVEILGKDTNDCPQLPPLVKATAEGGFTVREVSADAAYASQDNFEAVDAVGGTLFAAFKSNATGGIGGLFEKAFHYFSLHREEFLKHYHLRSNVESTFSAVKRKLGDSIRSKNDVSMKNEVLAKFVAHNLMCVIAAWYELGIDPVFVLPEDESESERAVLRFPHMPG
jgi:transposase